MNDVDAGSGEVRGLASWATGYEDTKQTFTMKPGLPGFMGKGVSP